MSDDQVGTLVAQLFETQQRLSELLGPEVDALVSPSGKTYLLSEAQQQLRSSEALQRREALLRTTVLDALPAHIAVLDQSGLVLNVNEAWRRFARENDNRDPTFGVGQNYLEAASETPEVVTGLKEVLSGERARFELEYPCHSPTEKRWFRIVAVPICDCDPLRAVVMHLDVTTLTLSQQRLIEQAALLDQTSDAILVWSKDLEITFWSKGAEDVYGWSREEAQGRPVTELIMPTDGEALEALEAVLEAGDWSGEVEHRTKQGSVVTVFSRLTLVRDNRGLPSSVLSINSDISEKKRLQDQFLRAQRLESLGTLAGGIAHDLNNVLAPILMSVELLREKLADQEEADLLKTVAGSAQRGADLIQQILTFARGVGGKKKPLSLVKVVEEVQSLIHDTFPKNITLEVRKGPGDHLVLGDATQLYQVLVNLCVNARDAMPTGGRITLSLGKRSGPDSVRDLEATTTTVGEVLLEVTDTGSGMSSEVQERLFEPFFTTKEPGHGTGLGLPTSFTIVRDHGGSIEVRSKVGRGSTFSILLPALEEGVSPEEPSHFRDSEMPRGRGQLILVVDDEAGIREMMTRILDRYDYEVLQAADGAEGLARYVQEAGRIAAVITDLGMPVMDGATLISALRRIDPGMIIIGSTGEVTPENVARVFAAGLKHFLPKPYTARDLLECLHKALQEQNSGWNEHPVSFTGVPSATSAGQPETVLVVDDELAILNLVKRALGSMGYTVLTSSSAEKGLQTLAESSQNISLVLTDLSMQGLGGVEFAKRVQAKYPKVRIVFSSGYLAGPHPEMPQIPVLPKPYTVRELKHCIRSVLDTVNPT